MLRGKKFRFSKPFQITISVFASIIGCLLLCFLTGYLVDRYSQENLDVMKLEAIKTLERSLQQNSDNAWFYYEDAIDIARHIRPAAHTELYIYGKTPMTPEILKSIQDNNAALSILKNGAAQPHCSVLFDNRSSVFRRNTNLLNLKLITEILCARSLYRLENGQHQQGIDDALSAMLIGKHLAGIAPTVLDQLNGLNILFWGFSTLSAGVSSGAFSENELKKISSFLNALEREWPPVHSAMEKHTSNLKIFIANSSIASTIHLVLIPHHGTEPSIFLTLLLRLRYWRYFFSPRRAFIMRFRFIDEIIAEVKQIEKKTKLQAGWTADETFPYFFDQSIARHHRINRIPEIFTPKFTNKGLLVNLTRLRMLNCACLIQQHQMHEGAYPPDLSEFDERTVTDPNTRASWEYVPMGDEALLKSPGLNPGRSYDDVILLLSKKGIPYYLSQKRGTGKHE